MLAIANKYGSVDLTKSGLSKRYMHVAGKRLQPLCRKLNIKYAEAIVGWKDNGRYPSNPITNGVVVSVQSAPKLLLEIEAREKRNPPEKRLAARRRRREERKRKEQERREELRNAGITNPSSRAAQWFEEGYISQYEAQLIQFKSAYRHEHTDYDFQIEMAVEQAEALLAEIDYDREDRRRLFQDAREQARYAKSEDPIPCSWEAYLAAYPFPEDDVAKALAAVLQDPVKSHPVWFCEAVLAVKRADLPLDLLGYEKIKTAIDRWRSCRWS